MPSLSLADAVFPYLTCLATACLFRVIPAASAAHVLQLLVGELVALLLCERQDVLGGLAGLRLLHLLGGEVLELHRMPPWSYFRLCICAHASTVFTLSHNAIIAPVSYFTVTFTVTVLLPDM